jgi:hypothetical protein
MKYPGVFRLFITHFGRSNDGITKKPLPSATSQEPLRFVFDTWPENSPVNSQLPMSSSAIRFFDRTRGRLRLLSDCICGITKEAYATT